MSIPMRDRIATVLVATGTLIYVLWFTARGALTPVRSR